MTTQLFVSLKNFIRACSALGIAALFALSAPMASAVEPLNNEAGKSGEIQQSSLSVGTVSLVWGKAYIESPDQPRQLIKVGSSIKVSDKITTAANGTVHIQFVDKAYLSVRPDSELEISSYDYNPEKPQLSEVKYNLIFGITRSISGEAAKAARQRFRLNTPIAAIGVRGTDFVVSATDSTTRALVTEGTIVLAPFSAECSFDAFGPCDVNAVELTGNSLQVIELDGSTPLPRLLASTEIRDSDTLRAEVQQAISRADETATENNAASRDVYVEEAAAVKVADAAADLQQSIPTVAPEPEPIQDPDFTPDAPLVVADISDRQLVWGRYAVAGLNEQDRVSLSYAEASNGRETTVGNSAYGLFRTENGSKRLDKGLEVVSFSLNSAQAFYNSSTGVVAMEVSGGSLGIDFLENSFATELNLNHSATGPVNFFATGRLHDGGYFYSRTDTQRIAGAVSLDGQEAGYFFERQLQDGGIQGLTLWDSQ